MESPLTFQPTHTGHFKSNKIPVHVRTCPAYLYLIVTGQCALLLSSFNLSQSGSILMHLQSNPNQFNKQLLNNQHTGQDDKSCGDRDKREAVEVLEAVHNIVMKANV